MSHCRCGRRYEIDIDLEYRCFTCEPRLPAGWLSRVLAEAKQSRATAERQPSLREST